MFSKLLIANRGEIACRIARTARRMGIPTVAVYSDADRGSLHVEVCDEAFRIGPAAASESYLSIEAVLEAARRSGAKAIHPGYGFLSENADFAAACEAVGLTFIGPPASAIRALGNKARAKALLEQAGVPLLPGYHGDQQGTALLRREARRIGYPILVKAAAGGGGKGMRIVPSAAEFDSALAACRREALAAFGDETVLLEKLLQPARHVEVQLLADLQGGCTTLYERDCSVQRRHQKVIEEAPAPGISDEIRAAMSRAASAAATAAGYVGAGTAEFLLAPGGAFYFLEMNTRLQVEHPVTEAITGMDLVEWQLRIASGEHVPQRPPLHGHAIEARIYAENPAQGFLPSTGRLVHVSFPEASGVRVDSGVREGDEVTAWYDPMIAKLIVHGRDRDEALRRLERALGEVRIVGVESNVSFLSRLAGCPSFVRAQLDTDLIEREGASLFAAADDAPPEAFVAAALAVLLDELQQADKRPRSPWNECSGWRLNAKGTRSLEFSCETRSCAVTIGYEGGAYDVTIDGCTYRVRGERRSHAEIRVDMDGRRFHAAVIAREERLHVFLQGLHYELARNDALRVQARSSLPEGSIAAPLPGRIVALLSAPGERLAKGTPLLILEAMKMEHTLAAPGAGTLKAFRYGLGEHVVQGAELVEFEFDPPAGAAEIRIQP